MAAIAAQKYSPAEETEVQQWLTTADRLKASPNESSILDSLNTHLSTRTTLLGTKPSKADVAIYETLAPTVSAWTPEQRTGEKGYHHIVRHVDFVQNSPVFGLDVKDDAKVNINPDDVLYVKPPVDAKAEKERLKKEKAAAAAAAAGGDGATATIADRTEAAAETVVEEATEAAAAAIEMALAPGAPPSIGGEGH